MCLFLINLYFLSPVYYNIKSFLNLYKNTSYCLRKHVQRQSDKVLFVSYKCTLKAVSN